MIHSKFIEVTVTQESQHVHLSNKLLSSRDGRHIKCMGVKVSQAFHIVSFPPWHLWISHITSYCVCKALANLAAAVLCALMWPCIH